MYKVFSRFNCENKVNISSIENKIFSIDDGRLTGTGNDDMIPIRKQKLSFEIVGA